MKSLLIIFVKNPVIGEVKTRLAKDTGHEKAYEIYLHLLEKTQLTVYKLPYDKVVYYSSSVMNNDIWHDDYYKKKVQTGHNLGDKMSNAIKESFEEGYNKVCIIGSDCFDITESIIIEAFEELDKNDVVIGPASDGGYYLLGMRRFIGGLFKNKPWSQSSLLKTTIETIERERLHYQMLTELNDIDTKEDIVQPELLKILNK